MTDNDAMHVLVHRKEDEIVLSYFIGRNVEQPLADRHAAGAFIMRPFDVFIAPHGQPKSFRQIGEE